MTVVAEHPGSFHRDQLETNLRYQEAVLCKLVKIEGKSGLTRSTHDDETEVPDNSLVLVLDPDGNAQGPPGSTLIVRGTAVLENAEGPVKVACFRIAG